MVEDKITIPEIKDAIKRSGYLIESRLTNILANRGFFVNPNSTYPDSITGKSREIDLHTISCIHRKHMKLNIPIRIDIGLNLSIECSNNPQPAVFFKRMESKKYTIVDRFKYSCTDLPIVNEDESLDWNLKEFYTSNDFHYNLTERCSQYCSFSLKKNSSGSKKREWLASHTDGLHDTFNKLFDFVEYQQKRLDKMQYPPNKVVTQFMIYPILVLQGDLFEAYETPGILKLKKVNHTIFEFNRFNGENSESLLIDVVKESFFPKYLDILQNDMNKLKELYTNFYTGQTVVELKLDDNEYSVI